MDRNEAAFAGAKEGMHSKAEPLVDISDLVFDEDGYLHFQVNADGYGLEGLFRLHDPANGSDMTLVSIDYGYLHPVIEAQWDRIEAALTEASWDRYNEMDSVVQMKDRVVRAMEAAGYHHNDMESYDGWQQFLGEGGGSLCFGNFSEAAEWLRGVVFDEPDTQRAVDEIMNEANAEGLNEIVANATERSCIGGDFDRSHEKDLF